MQLLGDIPERVSVAVSGGVDSMVLLDFLIKGRRDVTILHYHHGTEHGDEAYDFVNNIAVSLNARFISEELQEAVPQGESKENFWRKCRYNFLDRHADQPIFLGHHLDDVVETWLFSSFHGVPKIIPYQRNNCYRPMLQVKKEEILDWADRHGVPYITDPSNENTGFMRNKIRHEIVPKVLEVNPGIHKVLAKQVKLHYDNTLKANTG